MFTLLDINIFSLISLTPTLYQVHTMELASVQEIKGFVVLPVLFHAPSGKVPKAAHYIYIKKHSSKDEGLSSRSLFIVNIPLGSGLATLKQFFGKHATGAIIESFVECKKDSSINLAKLTSDLVTHKQSPFPHLPNHCSLITFIDQDACDLAYQCIKKLVKSSRCPVWTLADPLGSARYRKLAQSHILDIAQLNRSIFQDMSEFNRREETSYEELSKLGSTVDEDGFITVVGPHKKTRDEILGRVKTNNSEILAQAQEKMKKKEKQDFYKFQIREKKKLEMNDLLKKFKDDQEKIKVMKERKRFRPY
ncbi:Essential protein involved in rRNA processing and ribosome biogenesis [Komagataella phaffii GS115]|uniref:Essential protein involved in rRNA processing and ribosome biogenesis n=2 Tax=Komagataella phaffii TaxID=460519 RepID=C4QWV2_KOMPG|nr:Essential protein involved in rRNA processing and ribosome biogenesis [Komagataella phaffii GS115]CAY67725.1 Essential protein involved in rRNA processing and ribosome biogenesis [Komagataella phaffii GS115]